MAYDGITMAAVCRELKTMLHDSRIERINQPNPREIVLILRNRERSFSLLCSAESQFPRVHLTENRQENPAQAPAFCMLLRKHLSGARLLSVDQLGLERILSLTFRGLDDFGHDTKKTLICEIMGKHSNLILTQPTDEGTRILGAVKIVTGEMSRHRAVLPGELYIAPPTQEKLDLHKLTEESLAEQLAAMTELQPQQALVNAVLGIGPETAREIVYRAAGVDEVHPLEMARPLTVQLLQLAEMVAAGSLSPCIARIPGEKPRFSPIILTNIPPEHLEICKTANQCLDRFFGELIHNRRHGELKRQLQQAASAAHSRVKKKLQLQQKEYKEMEGADRYRIWGEMLTAAIHLAKPGMKEVDVPDYYSEEQKTIRIPLNPAYPPQVNAQRYFKKYRKLKDGAKILSRRLQETTDELSYLESLLISLEHADYEALPEIREEMESVGYLRTSRAKKKTDDPVSSPLHFLSPDGIDILVGKNNRQNDRLSLRDAGPNDTWLHTKDIPGSHVVIKHADPPESTLVYAARLAVRYSKASASQNVPVDYTHIRHVRKPKGAKPGMVIYTHQRTLYVTP